MAMHYVGQGQGHAAGVCEAVRQSIVKCCVQDHQNDPVAMAAWLENKSPENASVWVRSADSVALVAVRENTIVGFALAVFDELALCYVVHEALHQGIGKALLLAIESQVRSRGIEALRLESTRTAEAFYARNGYFASGPVQVWAGMEGLPMAKALMADPAEKRTTWP
ncbi:MAG: N-acetyltransferase [Ideonella sp. MAG2]|nr:MAG: N-acetyltransferase [Ideonella sp. MAG2]